MELVCQSPGFQRRRLCELLYNASRVVEVRPKGSGFRVNLCLRIWFSATSNCQFAHEFASLADVELKQAINPKGSYACSCTASFWGSATLAAATKSGSAASPFYGRRVDQISNYHHFYFLTILIPLRHPKTQIITTYASTLNSPKNPT